MRLLVPDSTEAHTLLKGKGKDRNRCEQPRTNQQQPTTTNNHQQHNIIFKTLNKVPTLKCSMCNVQCAMCNVQLPQQIDPFQVVKFFNTYPTMPWPFVSTLPVLLGRTCHRATSISSRHGRFSTDVPPPPAKKERSFH